MAAKTAHDPRRDLWRLIRAQEGAVQRDQLYAAGLTRMAVRHRIATARLHPKWPGVFAVGRPELSQRGVWIAALLACGRQVALSHGSAMAYYGLGREERGIEMSVHLHAHPRRRGITIHRRRTLEPRHIRVDGPIRVTTPIVSLIDFAARHDGDEVEAAVNAADRLNVITIPQLRIGLDNYPGWTGAPLLRQVLDRRTFRMTQSKLERLFIPIALRAGLGRPQTQRRLNGFKVDFYWPDLGLVVETDGLQYHRTAAQQATDRVRDQTHTAAGLICLRFTHAQVRYEPDHVETVLRAVAHRRHPRDRRGPHPR